MSQVRVKLIEFTRLDVPPRANSLLVEPYRVVLSDGRSSCEIPMTRIARVMRKDSRIALMVAKEEAGNVVFEVKERFVGPSRGTTEQVERELRAYRDRLREDDGREYIRCPACGEQIDRTGLPHGVRLICSACSHYVEPGGTALNPGESALIGRCPGCRKIRPLHEYGGGKVVSFVVFTHWHETKYVTCSGCASMRALGDLLVSGTAGWWGIPWGLILTPAFILKNSLTLGRAIMNGFLTPAITTVDITKAVDDDPARIALAENDHPAAQYTLGCSLFEAGEVRAALISLSFATRACPNHVDAWAKLAAVHVRLEDIDSAIAAAREAARDPLHAPLYEVLLAAKRKSRCVSGDETVDDVAWRDSSLGQSTWAGEPNWPSLWREQLAEMRRRGTPAPDIMTPDRGLRLRVCPEGHEQVAIENPSPSMPPLDELGAYFRQPIGASTCEKCGGAVETACVILGTWLPTADRDLIITVASGGIEEMVAVDRNGSAEAVGPDHPFLGELPKTRTWPHMINDADRTPLERFTAGLMPQLLTNMQAKAAASPGDGVVDPETEWLRLLDMSDGDALWRAFDQAHLQDDQITRDLIREGLVHHRWGRLEEARLAFSRALANAPHHAVALFAMARVQDESGDADGVSETLARVNPGRLGGRTGLRQRFFEIACRGAEVKSKNGAWIQAARLFHLATMFVDHPRAWYHLALCHGNGGVWPEAVPILSLSRESSLVKLLVAKGHNLRVAQGERGRPMVFVLQQRPADDFLRFACATRWRTPDGAVVASAVAPIKVGDVFLTTPSDEIADLRCVPSIEREPGDVFYPAEYAQEG